MIANSENKIIINAEEVRQYLYCKRIIYWRRVAGFTTTKSGLMEAGEEFHEMRKTYNYIRKGDIANYRDQYYFHPKYRIGGKVDLLRELEDEIIPVETKRFYNDRIRPSHGHIAQAVVGGMAASYELEKDFTTIEIKYWRGIKSMIDVTAKMKADILEVIQNMREMISDQNIPEPTKHKKKCERCEFNKICFSV